MAYILNTFVKRYLRDAGQAEADWRALKANTDYGIALARGAAHDPIQSKIPAAFRDGGFTALKDGEGSLVRYVGSPDEESGRLERYRQILENCLLTVEPMEDPDRPDRRMLRVSKP